MLRLAPPLTILVLIGPVVAGLVGVALPAFGYLPVLGGESFGLAPFADLAATAGLGRSILLSLAAGLITTLAALLVVTFFIAGWLGTPVFAVLRRIVSPLLSVPHAAAAFGIAFLIAPSGWLVRLVSPELTGWRYPPDFLVVNDPMGLAMMAGLVAKEIPFLLLMALAALPQTDAARSAHVAASLGYGKTAGFLFAVFPRLYRQIRLPVFAVIAYASSVVDVALVLGPTNPPPLAVQLVRWMNDPDLAMRFRASAGALLQIAVTLSAIAVWILGERLVARLGAAAVASGRRGTADGAVRFAAAAAMSLAVAAIVLGLAGLAVWSLAGPWRFPDVLPASFTLEGWHRAAGTLADPVAATFVVGIVATLVALVLTLACLENEARTGRDGGDRSLLVLYLPLLVPQVAFLYGLQVLFFRFGLDGTLGAVVVAHLVFVLPYVFLALSDPWRAFDRRYVAVAATLGASPARAFWRVRAPMLLAAILVAAAVGFAVSVGQYLPTLLVGGGRVPTVTTEAVALAAGRDRRVIGVYAIVQMVLPFVGFWIALALPAVLYRDRSAMRAAA